MASAFIRAGRPYGLFRNAGGKFERFLGSPDLAETLRIAIKLEDRASRERARQSVQDIARAKLSIGSHLSDFQLCLSSKTVSRKHIRLTVSRVRTIAKGCRARKLSDLTAPRVDRVLRRLQKMNGLSEASRRNMQWAIAAFIRWAIDEGRIDHNPLLNSN